MKVPAVAMGTDSFRHGPQEIVSAGMRFAIWIDDRLREADLAVARDLRRLGASVMLIGSGLPADAGDLVMQLPPWPSGLAIPHGHRSRAACGRSAGAPLGCGLRLIPFRLVRRQRRDGPAAHIERKASK